MTKFLNAAARALTADDTPVALRTAAACALLSALDQGLPLPPGSQRAIWRHVQLTGAPYIRFSGLGTISDLALGRELVETVLSAEVGNDARELATEVLKADSNAQLISDSDLDHLVDAVKSEIDAHLAAELIAARHAVSALDFERLRLVRGRFFNSNAAGIRRAALEIDEQIPGDDVSFLSDALNDVDAEVRMAAASSFGWKRRLRHNQSVLRMIEQRLAVESHEGAHSALAEARANLLHSHPKIPF